MAYQDIADMLMPRIQASAELLGQADHPPARGWNGYNTRELLKVISFLNGGEEIWYGRPGGSVQISNVRPLTELRDAKTVVIPVGKRQSVSAAKIDIQNWDGLTPHPEEYSSSLMKSTRREDVEFENFTESVETTFSFKQGGEAAQFALEQSIKLGFQGQHGSELHEETSSGQETVTGAKPVAAAGSDVEYWRTWENQRSIVRHTGIGEVDFAVTIGRRGRGSGGRHVWEKHKGKYTRHIYYASFWEDFVPMIKRRGRRDHDCYEYFQTHPVSQEMIDRITAPLDIPFVNESKPFDQFANIKGHIDTIRGPNPAVLETLRKYKDAGVDISLT